MFRLGILALALSTAAFAQQTIPGTFTTLPPDHVAGSTVPLISTPTLTLSNGFSPATITVSQSTVTEQPQMLAGPMPQSEGIDAETPNSNEPSPPDFNFAVVAPSSAFNFGGTGPSIGDISKQYNRGHVQSHQRYTNDDIDRLNSGNGGFAANYANGEPITNLNHNNGFSPMSGIANMPDAISHPEASELAGTQNPTSEGQSNATASNADQGHAEGQATTPALGEAQPTHGSPEGQPLPASDSPH